MSRKKISLKRRKLESKRVQELEEMNHQRDVQKTKEFMEVPPEDSNYCE
jgi:hypothetical protein